MRPRQASHELLEEQGSGDGARVGVIAHVLQVGDLRIELAAIAALQRQLPEALVGAFSRGNNLIDQRLIVAEDGRHLRAECSKRGASQGCDVDNRVWIVAFAGEHQRIGHHQSAFGIGVLDFDRLAAVDGQARRPSSWRYPEGILSVHIR